MFLEAYDLIDHTIIGKRIHRRVRHKGMSNRLKHARLHIPSDVRLDDINVHKSRC